MSEKVNVLVIGKGGREHALIWKLAQSPRAGKLYCAPGNVGTGTDGVNVPIEVDEFDKLIRFAVKEDIGLVVIGPEDPLANGLADKMREAGLKVFGPSQAAAQIEASKVFAKRLMRHTDVPTAEFQIFDHPAQAKQWIETRDYPLVVKADGLAAGKGVIVCQSVQDAFAAVDRIMVKEEFGQAAGRQIIVEKRLEGSELSVLALVCGRSIVTLPTAQDHKRLYDNDAGPNTGGMGAYCPANIGDRKMMQEIEEHVFVPTIHALRRAKTPFRGVLYAGLMATKRGVQVLEFNCRFGDPETQCIMMRLRTDLLSLLESVADDRLGEFAEAGIEWDPRPAVTVVLASGGYPGPYRKDQVIEGIAEADVMPDVKVFHGGTKTLDGRTVTDGGRVLGVTALGDNLTKARENVYAAVAKIKFIGMTYRKDIAARPST